MHVASVVRMAVVAAILPLASASIAARTAAADVDTLTPLLPGLIDQAGRPVTAARFAGRSVLVNFIFTRCGSTCPMQTAQLARFDRDLPPALRDTVALLSVSVDPQNDTPAALGRFARRFGADTRHWSFVTGRPQDVARLTSTFSAMRPGGGGFGFHSSELWMFDARHRMIQRYAGAPLSDARLRADLLTLAATRS